MRSQQRLSPPRPDHQALGVILAAMGAVTADYAVGQSQQNVSPSAQTQNNATRRPVAAPNTRAQAPAATTPPKPSLLNRFFGGNKNAQQPGNNSKQDTSAKQSPPLWKKIPFLGGHSGTSTEESPARTATAGQYRAPATSHPGSAQANAKGSTPGPKDNQPGVQNPQRLASLGSARPGTRAATPEPSPNRPGIQNPQRFATLDPGPSARKPDSLPPVSQRRAFPDRPGLSTRAETRLPNGNVVRTASDGSVTDMHIAQHNMSVHYGLSGSRQIRVEQPDGSRIVLASRGVPYMQKPWNFGAQAFDHRTFLDNGKIYHQFYRPYSYGNTKLDVYAPQRFYSQDFYQWAAKPQPWVPPAWTYNTKQQPWAAHYQTYFTPQSSYSSPVLWLTDFVLAMSLFEAYNAHPLPAQTLPAAPQRAVSPAQEPGQTLQAATAPAPIEQTPMAQTRAPDSSSAPAAPATLARTAYSPIVAPPVANLPPAVPTAPIIAAPAASPVEPTPGLANPTGTDDNSVSPTMWQRFVNFIRGLWGETPSAQTVVARTSPAKAPVAAETVAADSAAPITTDVKAMVADEIERQIEQESREARGNAQDQEPKPGAGSVVEELRSPTQHVLVVASDLDLVDDTGRRCMISEGDVVQIISGVNAKTGTASGVVLSSKGGVECAHSTTVDIDVSDLQEMQNHMRATIDQGLANTPRGAAEATVTPAFVAAAPQPDAEAKSVIEQQKTLVATADRS
jgi:hypothetical protein